MKRKIKIAVTVIVIIIGVIIAFVKPPGQKNSYTSPNKQFETEDQRVQYINKFASAGKVSQEQGGSGNTEDSGGYTGIVIRKEQSLIDLNVVNLDGMFAIDNELQMPIKSLLVIHKDTLGLSEQALKNYYTQNVELIKQLYGINDYNGFISFKNTLDGFNGSKQITYAEIKDGTIQKHGDLISFDLAFLTEKQEVLVDYKLLVTENTEKSKDLYKIVW